ncbi:hypothetical protein MN0502_14380 [Arthrobacter sp. MN05-02]|nr:hypothetical protein MN0502_14380 [Arthrobacter sp. MN05-02]
MSRTRTPWFCDLPSGSAPARRSQLHLLAYALHQPCRPRNGAGAVAGDHVAIAAAGPLVLVAHARRFARCPTGPFPAGQNRYTIVVSDRLAGAGERKSADQGGAPATVAVSSR